MLFPHVINTFRQCLIQLLTFQQLQLVFIIDCMLSMETPCGLKVNTLQWLKYN